MLVQTPSKKKKKMLVQNQTYIKVILYGSFLATFIIC